MQFFSIISFLNYSKFYDAELYQTFLTPFKRPFRITKGNTIIELAPSPYFFFFIKRICLDAMNMLARFDEIAAITFQDIKETKCQTK